MKSILKKLFIILILTTYYLILNTGGTAAAGFSISLDPPLTYIKMRPASEVSVPVKIKNHEDSAVTLVMDAIPFTTKDDTGQVILINEPLPIASMIKILHNDKQATEVSLASGQTIDLSLNIKVPEDYQGADDHYFSLIFSAKNLPVPRSSLKTEGKEKEAYGFSQIQPAIATNIILSVDSNEKNKKLNLNAEFSTARIRREGPVDFKVRITNSGHQALPVEGEILIQNLFGQTVGKVDLPLLYILAGKSRLYEKVSWPETFLVGPYRASLKLHTPDGQRLVNQQTFFFALPYQTTVLTVILLLAVLTIVTKIKRRLNS